MLAVSFGAMIGFGWVVLTGEWLSAAGSLGAVLAFVLGGVLVLFVGLTYAELVAALPKVGGEHEYALRALGVRASFVASWAIALGYVSVVAFEAVALPTTLEYLLPDYKVGSLWSVAGYDVYASWAAIGIAGAVVIAAVNYVGIKPSSVFQAIAVLLLLAVGALLLVGVGVGGSAANFAPLFSGGAAGLLTVLLMTPFLFVGFDIIPQSAEEIKVPYRQIGMLLVVSVLLATSWYVLVILGVSSGLGRSALAESELPTADAMGAMFGSPVFANILVLGGVAGILTSWNGFMIGGSRILYAMAASGMLPAWLARLHPRYRTPSNAILVVGGLSLIAPLFGREALVWLVDAGGLNIVVAYLMTAVSFLVLRRTEPTLPRPFRAGRTPAIGIIAAVLSLGIGVQYLPGMPAGLIWPYEWAIVLAWWIAGLVFLLRLRSETVTVRPPPP